MDRELLHVIDLMNGPAVAAQVLRASVRLGLWDALDRGIKTPEALARELEVDVRGLRTLMDALVALGLVEMTDGRYMLTEHARRYLTPSSPDSIADFVHIAANPLIWQALFDLDAAVRAGGAVIDHHAEEPNHPFWQEFARGSTAMARFSARLIVDHLKSWGAERASLKVLDVAAGSGMYGFTFLETFPQAHVTALDWPATLERTRENANRLGVADRVAWLPGDAFSVEFDGTWDVIIVSNFIHHFPPERAQELLKRLEPHLAAGGRLLLNDFFALSENPAEDPGPYLFGIIMLVWSRGGRIYSLKEGQQMLEAAGFRVVDRVIPEKWRHRCLVATR